MHLFQLKRIVAIIIYLFISYNFASTDIYPQEIQFIDIPSSINPVGSGARALGMGGAFIAVADDATASSWNPGGLIQLERPELSIVYAFFSRSEDNDFGLRPEASGPQDVSKNELNYMSAAFPFSLFRHNMILSVNYQYLYDFSREWNFILKTEDQNYSDITKTSYRQSGGLSAIGLAYCLQISPKISFGVTYNIWNDMLRNNGWEESAHRSIIGITNGVNFSFESNGISKYDFSGENFNFGMLWNLTDKLALGAVLKTSFEADLKIDSGYTSVLAYPDQPSNNVHVSETISEDKKLKMPKSYGIGLSYRVSDNLTASFDFYRTEWNEYILKDGQGNRVSPITGKSMNDSDIDPTNQLRLGAEYLLIGQKSIIPVRGGVFHDPAPSDGKKDDYYGFSLGSGLIAGKYIFDIAYQYRFGNNIGNHIFENLNFSQDVKEHTLYSSLIIHF